MNLRLVVRVASLLILILQALPLRAAGDGVGFQQQAQIVSQSGDSVVLNGVRWGFRDNDFGKAIFKETTLRMDQVREVYYYSEPFNVTGPSTILNRYQAHGLLFFEMKDPSAIQSADGAHDIGIGISAEARRDTPAYSALKGLQKFYKLHYQILTEKDRLQWGLGIWKERIERFRLKLDDGQKQQLLRNAIQEACQDHSQGWYHAITNSCVAAASRLMNTVLPAARQLKIWTIPHVWFNLKLGIPSRTPGYLVRRGVAEFEGVWEPGLAAVDFPTSSGTYSIILKNLPEGAGSVAGAGVRATPSSTPGEGVSGAVAELPVASAATLQRAQELGVFDEVRDDATVLKEIRTSLDHDVMLH